MMEMNSMVSEESLGVGPGVGPGSVVVAQWPEVVPGVSWASRMGLVSRSKNGSKTSRE
jgi:hypothetical protein